MKKHNQNNVEMYMAKETPTNMAGRQITGPKLLVWLPAQIAMKFQLMHNESS